MSPRMAACAATAVIAFAGCGGDDDKDKKDTRSRSGTRTTAVAGLPAPNEPLSERIAAAQAAFATGDCQKAVPFFHVRERGEDVEAGAPPSAEECRTFAEFGSALRSLNFGKSQEFGTVAVVDAQSGKDTGSTLWVVDDNGSWAFLPGSQLIPDAKDPDVKQVGTEPKAGNKFDANAAAWVKGVQDKDCDTVWRLLNPASGLVSLRQNDKAKYCKDFTAAYGRDSFPQRVADTPDLKPEPLGKTSDYAFYSLKTKNGSVYTLVLTTNPTSGFKPQELEGHDPDGVFNYYRNKDGTSA